MSSKKFFSGLIIGGIIGAVAALLNAPQSGEKTRKALEQTSEEMKDKAEQKAQELKAKTEEIVNEMQKKGDDLCDRVQGLIKKITESHNMHL